MRELTSQLKQEAPLIYEAMIGERDRCPGCPRLALGASVHPPTFVTRGGGRYMAQSLLQSSAAVTVGVVGMAHMDGIEAQLGWKKRPCAPPM